MGFQIHTFEKIELLKHLRNNYFKVVERVECDRNKNILFFYLIVWQEKVALLTNNCFYFVLVGDCGI